MSLPIRCLTVWLIAIIVLCSCAPSAAVVPLPSATPISATSTPYPTPTHPLATLAPSPTPLPSPTSARQVLPQVLDPAFIFVGETIPDGTNLQPGQKFKKTWTLKNGGSLAWDPGMVLVRTSSSPANETLGGPEQIPLAQKLEPGATIQIEVDLVAPNQNGRFTVFYELQNATGKPVADSHIWVTITVGNVPMPGSGSITVQLVAASMRSTEFTVDFCMQVPDARQWYPWGVMLSANQQSYSPTGSRIDPAGATTAHKCFRFSFPVSIASGTAYTLVIEKIELPPEVHQAENCASAQRTLKAMYPGLDFQCSGPGSWYSNLVLPTGMTKEQADQLILDTMSSSIYGPWQVDGIAP